MTESVRIAADRPICHDNRNQIFARLLWSLTKCMSYFVYQNIKFKRMNFNWLFAVLPIY